MSGHSVKPSIRQIRFTNCFHFLKYFSSCYFLGFSVSGFYRYIFLDVSMGGSRIFDWGRPRIEKARDDCLKVALYPLKSWPIGGGGDMALCPPPLTALVSNYVYFLEMARKSTVISCQTDHGTSKKKSTTQLYRWAPTL